MAQFSYTTGNPNNLVGGGNASMNDIQGGFVDLRSFVNGGNLAEDNLPNLSAAFTTYKTFASGSAVLGPAAAVSAYAVAMNGGAASNQATQAAGTPTARHAFRLDPTGFNANSRVTKLNLSCVLITNAVAPGVNFTVALQQVTAFGGASGTEPHIATISANVSGSGATFTTPGAGAPTFATSGDFTMPATGFYVISVLNSSTMAANSLVTINAQLQVRQV